MGTKRTISLKQGGERTYITPVTYTFEDYFKLSDATRGIWYFLKALLSLFRVPTFIAYGEEERPYFVGGFDPTLTWNKKTHIRHPLTLLWLLCMEAVLFTRILFGVRSFRELRYVCAYYKNSSLVIGKTFDTGMPLSVYGYMQVDGWSSGQMVTECYMDVSDEVIIEDLYAHKDYDFKAEAASYDHDRSVFMVFDNTTISKLLEWVEASKSDSNIVSFLRNIDT